MCFDSLLLCVLSRQLWTVLEVLVIWLDLKEHKMCKAFCEVYDEGSYDDTYEARTLDLEQTS
jgi:hypothetical protein